MKDPEGNITNYRIPTLEEAIRWARGKTILILDKKDVPMERTAQLITDMQAEPYVMITVHDGASARFFYEKNPNFMFEAFVKTKEAVQDYEDNDIPWSHIMAYVGPKITPEVRRLIEWFDVKFMREVNRNIVYEKVHKRFGFGNPPDSKILKIGINNLNFHLEYIDWLAERRNYLAGDDFSLADITAAAHLSVIDYLGDVPWDGYKNAKLWYSKIKSRPSFKEILKDNIKGILPAKHYANLDF